MNTTTTEDLRGLTFGRLTVIGFAEDYVTPKNYREKQCLCRCECGSVKVVRTRYLKNGHTQSCGRCNKYDLSGDYGVCTTKSGKQFLFDLEDYDKIKQYVWSIGGNGYVQNSRNKLYLHRLILDAQSDECVDHINFNPLDNRKNNLRLCTKQENNRYVKKRSHNTSGAKGVCYNKQTHLYAAQLTYNGKHLHLGSYKTIEEASKAYKLKAKELFGEFYYDDDEPYPMQKIILTTQKG